MKVVTLIVNFNTGVRTELVNDGELNKMLVSIR